MRRYWYRRFRYWFWWFRWHRFRYRFCWYRFWWFRCYRSSWYRFRYRFCWFSWYRSCWYGFWWFRWYRFRFRFCWFRRYSFRRYRWLFCNWYTGWVDIFILTSFSCRMFMIFLVTLHKCQILYLSWKILKIIFIFSNRNFVNTSFTYFDIFPYINFSIIIVSKFNITKNFILYSRIRLIYNKPYSFVFQLILVF